VISQTHIPRAVVVALEEGDFSIFSSPNHANSFLSYYSAFHNVEADVLLDALQQASFVPVETVHPLGSADFFAPTGQNFVKRA
jgi:cytoskeletal protein RodZ